MLKKNFTYFAACEFCNCTLLKLYKGGKEAIINGIVKTLKLANQLHMRLRVRAVKRGEKGGVGGF
jgi:hypothetical protein